MKKAGKSKLIKRLAAVCLAVGMVLPMAFVAGGCEIIVKPDPNDPSKDFTVDIKPNNPSDDSQSDPNNNAETENPADPAPKEPDYSMYSEILQTVLTSDYYNDLIKNGNQQEYTFDPGHNLAEAIPYNFLSQKNENIQYIKDGRIRVNSMLYNFDDEKNNLYNRVELTYDNGDNDYMKQYLIKYDLSDYQQEFEELKMLYQGKYYQANFLFQEIDKQIDPSKVELVSEFSIYESTYNALLTRFNNSENISPLFTTGIIDNFTILNCKQTDNGCNYIDVNLISGRQFATACIRINPQSLTTFTDGIMHCKLISMYTENISAPTPITCYFQIFSSNNFLNTIK